MNLCIYARRSPFLGAAVFLMVGSYAFAAAQPAHRQPQARKTAAVQPKMTTGLKAAVKPPTSGTGFKPTQHPNVWVRFAPQPRTTGTADASIYVMPGASLPPGGITASVRAGVKAVTPPTVQTLPNGAKYVMTLPEEVNYATATIDSRGKVIVSCGTPTVPKESRKGAAK